MTRLGTVLDGKYEILKKVGQGGMSIVYLAMDKRLNKQWAVKEIKNDGSKSTKTLLKGLEREANILKDVDHPVLPRIVDIINENGTIYVVMDFVEGRPLSEVLKEEGAQPQDKVIAWAKSLASALDYLHSMNPPIIYRDMKPSNVMLKPDGTVKLIDFGTAKEYIVENNADTTALGTRGYAAPEQFGDAQGRGIYNTDARTDIYNLGATLYHLVTGKNPCEPPYEIKPIRQWNPMLSSGLEQIIIKCCQPSPEDRYQSCSELLYALDHYNELDDAYKAKARKKIVTFVTFAALSLVSAVCAVIGGVQKSKLKYQNYNEMTARAEDARLSATTAEEYDAALDYYKQAIEINPEESEAYLEYMDIYAYSYPESDSSSGEESLAEKGVSLAVRHIDEVKDDVKYQIAMIYYNECDDCKTAKKYFSMVVDENEFPDEVEQAKYYAAICESRLSSFSSEDMDNIYAFQTYNEDHISSSDQYKYINYENIMKLYTQQLSNFEDLDERALSLIDKANEDLEENENELNSKLPEDRKTDYYRKVFIANECSIYEWQIKDAEEFEQNGGASQTEKKLTAYEAIRDLSMQYINQLTVEGDMSSETKSSYANYAVKEAEACISLAELEQDAATNYDEAESIYKEAEELLGTDVSAADVYISHISYYKNRYTGNWTDEVKKQVKTLMVDAMKISVIADGEKTRWKDLQKDPELSRIYDGTYDEQGEE